MHVLDDQVCLYSLSGNHTHCTNTLGVVHNIILCSYVFCLKEAGSSIIEVSNLSKKSRIEYINCVGSDKFSPSMFIWGGPGGKTVKYINFYYFILAAVKLLCPGGFTPILKHLQNLTRQSHTRVIGYLIYII